MGSEMCIRDSLHSDLPRTGEPADDQPFLEIRATTASGDVTLHQS